MDLCTLTKESPLRSLVLEQACEFASYCQHLDRSCKRLGHTVPTAEMKTQLAEVFWAFMQEIDDYHAHCPQEAAKDTAEECRTIVGPWLFRSRFFSRSFLKPHGYPGDFRIIDWMYDLEHHGCDDPTEPGIVNCLDYLYWTVHSVQGVWERRAWLTQLLLAECARKNGHLRILDVACGGARYLKDFLSTLDDPSHVEITLIDQDAAALAFSQTCSLAPWAFQMTFLQRPVTQFTNAVPGQQFDVVISAGLFDYLEVWLAKKLLAHMADVTAPGGVTAMTNFHPADPSRVVKEWMVDWWLVFRDEQEVADLFPDPAKVHVVRSANQSLVMASARK